MIDPVATARTARETLAGALASLQSPGVPPELFDVAEPVARAMGALHGIEASRGARLEGAAVALEATRGALGLLQTTPITHPAVEAAIEAVAGSLGMVHALASLGQAPSLVPSTERVRERPDSPVAQPAAAAPQYAEPARAYQAAAAQYPGPHYPGPHYPDEEQRYAPAQPQHPDAQPDYGAVPQHYAPVPQQHDPPAPQHYRAAQPQRHEPAAQHHPAAEAQHRPHPAATEPSRVYSARGAPQPAAPAVPAEQARSTQVAPGAAYVGAHRPPATQAAGGGRARGLPLEQLARFDAELGAHSPSNLYKGLAGNDVIEAGGLFVATYKVPKVGTEVHLHISLPGGFEFDARGVVQWTRDAPHSGHGDAGAPPGFGAQLVDLGEQERGLIHRYAKNREPLFYDDF